MKVLSKIQSPKSKIGTVLFFTASAIFVIFAAISTAGSSASDKLTVYVVNYPLKYFAERIAGDHAKVVFPAPADVDPAFWMPDTKTILEYQKADLILLNGAGYARWVNKVSLPRSKILNTSAKLKGRYITMDETITHSHGQGGEHAHENVAFTTWIDFTIAAKQAKSIADALGRKRSALRKTFQKNYKALEKDLLTLDQALVAIVSKDLSKYFIGSHPVYDYLARRYGLNIKSVHWEPDEAPGDAEWMELQTILKTHPAEWMIWEGNPMKKSVEILKSIGINSIVFDPCGNVPIEGDFLSVMLQNVENLKRAYR